MLRALTPAQKKHSPGATRERVSGMFLLGISVLHIIY